MTPTATGRACVAVAVVAVAVVAVALAGCDKVRQLVGERRASDKGAVAVEPIVLSESFAAKDGLMTLHYPADFAAQPVDADIVALSRNLPAGDADVLAFVAIDKPISSELGEFSRLSARSELKRPASWEYRKVSETKATCNGVPGLQIVATWKPEGTSGRSRRTWCAFLRDGHGYVFAYNTPENVALTHEPLLRSIVEATTFPRP